MSLLREFLIIVEDWRSVFPQPRTFRRGVRQALGSLVCLGRRCLTRIIWTNGGQNRSWSAEYFLHSRCQWEPQQLFQPILKHALAYCPQRLVGVAIDDTRLRKTGRSIPLPTAAGWPTPRTKSGRDEVYVQSFPMSGAKFQISAGGGMEPQWRKDGTELFYIAEDRTLMAVPVKLSSSASEPLQVGQAKPLFSVPVLDTFIVGRSYEVSNDGQRFLVRALASGATAPPLTVVLNWQTQLKK